MWQRAGMGKIRTTPRPAPALLERSPPMDALSPGSPAPDFLLPQAAGPAAGPALPTCAASRSCSPSRRRAGTRHGRKDWPRSTGCSRQAGFAGELLGLTHDGAWCQATFPDGPGAVPAAPGRRDGRRRRARRTASRAGRRCSCWTGTASSAGGTWPRPASPPAPRTCCAGLDALTGPAESRSRASGAGLTRREFLAAALGVAFALALQHRRRARRCRARRRATRSRPAAGLDRSGPSPSRCRSTAPPMRSRSSRA